MSSFLIVATSARAECIFGIHRVNVNKSLTYFCLDDDRFPMRRGDRGRDSSARGGSRSQLQGEENSSLSIEFRSASDFMSKANSISVSVPRVSLVRAQPIELSVPCHLSDQSVAVVCPFALLCLSALGFVQILQTSDGGSVQQVPPSTARPDRSNEMVRTV